MSSHPNFSGIWRSTYWFPSNTHEGEDTSEYIVRVHQRGDKLTIVSIPNAIEAHITINITVDHKLATGTWVEHTAPHEEFEGMVYSGAMQLLIADDGNSMDGQWVGIGREKLGNGEYEPRIYNGRWQLVRIKEPAVIVDEDVEEA